MTGPQTPRPHACTGEDMDGRQKELMEKARQRWKDTAHQRAGKPYRPSNGEEGEGFRISFCIQCVRGGYERTGVLADKPCDILERSFWNKIDDPDYPTEWVYDQDGDPTCTAFEPVEDDEETDEDREHFAADRERDRLKDARAERE